MSSQGDKQNILPKQVGSEASRKNILILAIQNTCSVYPKVDNDVVSPLEMSKFS